MKTKNILSLLLICAVMPLTGCNNETINSTDNEKDRSWKISSIDDSLEVNVYLKNKKLSYEVNKNDSSVVDESNLCILTDKTSFDKGLKFVEATEIITNSYEYENISGSYSKVFATFNEFTLTFEDSNNMLLDFIVRVYEDGYAFKQGIRAKDGKKGKLKVKEEQTYFTLPEGAETHSMEYNGKSQWFSYEEYYDVHSSKGLEGAKLSMPFLYKTADDVWSLISESELIGSGYVGMFLKGQENRQLQTSPAFGARMDIEVNYPFETPWRLGITGDLETITESTLVEDLYDDVDYWKPDNCESLSTEEQKIYDYDWVEPGIVAWDWLSYTGYRNQQDWDLHKSYIDLAVEMNWRYIIVDGGWEPWNLAQKAGFLDMMDYANERDIKVIAWGHAMNNFAGDRLIDTLDQWKAWGIAGIKIDFFDGQGVSNRDDLLITGQGESQLTIDFYEKVYQECAKRQMVVNCHGANKPTGERRIYPHVLNREAIRGNEMKSMNPRQLTSIPYLRGVTGPSDYTPTFMPITDDTTVGTQIGLHVLYESGLPSMAGKEKEYLNTAQYFDDDAVGPDALKDFMRNLPATWDELEYVLGTPRNDSVLARRKGDNWWVGGITVKGQTFDVDLSFLDDGEYSAEIFFDGETYNKLKYSIQDVTKSSKLSIPTNDNGGFAIRITKKLTGGNINE